MPPTICLKNVRVHNLAEIDLEIPKKQLVGFCGPSGSGKSSVAIDTLFAEGQRRYLDTFSTSERGLIDQPDKPDADLIDGVPPAIAVARSPESLSQRVTVASVTELLHYFQLAFARFGNVYCVPCQAVVERATPTSIADFVMRQLAGAQVMIGFRWSKASDQNGIQEAQSLTASGFQRAVFESGFCRIDALGNRPEELDVLVDRISVSPDSEKRLRESVEIAFRFGAESCFLLWQTTEPQTNSTVIDGVSYQKQSFFGKLKCSGCEREFRAFQPQEMSYNSPSGACPECEGLGVRQEFCHQKIVPHSNLSIETGLFSFLNDKPFAQLRQSLLNDIDFSPATPFNELDSSTQEETLAHLIGRLEEQLPQASKTLAKSLSSLRSWVTCEACQGTRFNREVLAYRLADQTLGEVLDMTIDDLKSWTKNALADLLKPAPHLSDTLNSKLDYLCEVGVGYLTPSRAVNQLSTGERQRVSMTNALGSNLVNMLYVFDEPCAGLHPADLPQLIGALKRLKTRGNTVVAVDHDLDLMMSSDFVAEFGPGAGIYGGQVIYAGTPDRMSEVEGSVTGDYVAGRRGFYSSENKRPPNRSAIKLVGAHGHNLKDLTVEFPLSLLCVVTGVSGSGKSSLVVETLYPAVSQRLGKMVDAGLPFENVLGTGAIDDVLLIDQSSIGIGSRSNPATYSKAFDAIRNVFAETLDARARNIKAGRFSFNTEGGRCEACKGEGSKQIDMQFLANLHVKCKFCNGDRYKQEVLNCKYRGRNIAEVLNMTVREAFSFFRGQKKVQSKLKPMMDVGLDYLRLGQPASTLSSGECQRLRLAGVLSTGRKARTLFLLDEPTVGLHYADVVKLLDCFDALLAEGHSLIVVEHNQMMMHAADHLIDLGPGPGALGGQVVATGSPKQVAGHPGSQTAEVLRRRTDRESRA